MLWDAFSGGGEGLFVSTNYVTMSEASILLSIDRQKTPT